MSHTNHLHRSSCFIRFSLFSERGFDQFGAFFGQVTIESSNSKQCFELNLPGARTSRHLDEQVLHDPQRTWSLTAACKDGLVVSLSARDIENEIKYEIFGGTYRIE